MVGREGMEGYPLTCHAYRGRCLHVHVVLRLPYEAPGVLGLGEAE